MHSCHAKPSPRLAPTPVTLRWLSTVLASTSIHFAFAQDLAFAQDRAPQTSAASWKVTVERAAVLAADPNWTATITYFRAPVIADNPIPRNTPKTTNPITGKTHELTGIASYYWQDQMTANGERFDKNAMTAAHKTLPINTRVRVTNAVNGKSVVVRINDRGPYKPGRVIDLSEAAAGLIDMHKVGLVPVKVEIISNETSNAR